MLIDWFTVAAQGVNFLVLLWLMKRFLYKPILTAINAREKRIADELAGAARQKADADTIAKELLAKTQSFDSERAALLAHAVADAGAEHDRLLAEARTEADALRLKQQTLWQKERASHGDRLRNLVTDEVFAIARRALGDLAGAELEERMVATLLARMRDLPSGAKQPWITALKNDRTGGVVRSRFELEAPSRALIQAAVNDICSGTVPLRFETASGSIGGIEVIVQGQRIAWTIIDYLQSLQAKVEALGTSPLPSGPPASAVAADVRRPAVAAAATVTPAVASPAAAPGAKPTIAPSAVPPPVVSAAVAPAAAAPGAVPRPTIAPSAAAPSAVPPPTVPPAAVAPPGVAPVAVAS